MVDDNDINDDVIKIDWKELEKNGKQFDEMIMIPNKMSGSRNSIAYQSAKNIQPRIKCLKSLERNMFRLEMRFFHRALMVNNNREYSSRTHYSSADHDNIYIKGDELTCLPHNSREQKLRLVVSNE